jgi:hypothetical protein
VRGRAGSGYSGDETGGRITKSRATFSFSEKAHGAATNLIDKADGT